MQNAAEYYKANEKALYIVVGPKARKFYIDNPTFDIGEMAYAMAKQCRFTGHMDQTWSVAEHSVLVMQLCERLKLADPLEGLLHDGAEAFLSDLAAPWKALLPDYKVLEARIDVPLRKHFSLPENITTGCKHADWLALFLEAHWLLPAGATDDWIAPEGIIEQAKSLHYDFPLVGDRPWRSARDLFLYHFERLVRNKECGRT